MGVATAVPGPVADSLTSNLDTCSKGGIQLPNSRVKYASIILLELSAFSGERSRAWPGFIM